MHANFSIPVAALVALVALPGCDSTTGITPPPDPTPQLIVTPTLASITAGGSLQLVVTARDEAGKPMTTSGVAWISSDAKVAGVSGAGLVRGQVAGATKITAWWNGMKGESTITVTPRPDSCAPPRGKGKDVSFKQTCVAR